MVRCEGRCGKRLRVGILKVDGGGWSSVVWELGF